MLKAPFPYFGGKSRIAPEVWRRLGNPTNYVEPFFGSGAMLLARPNTGKIETVNDLDGLLTNFWRAIKHAPDEVARYADWPVSEIDLHARHKWLINARADIERMLQEPDWFDAKAAGWWVWGISAWIGKGWGKREAAQLPSLIDAGEGINALLRRDCLPVLFDELSARLRHVRVAHGDWRRVIAPSIVETRKRATAVFLDPPYDLGVRDDDLYAQDSSAPARVTRAWATENGDNPLFRIALCGYDLEHESAMPGNWEMLRWKAGGGYGSQGNGRGRENAKRETIWFSPHCLGVERQLSLWETS